jgi:sec-independent protein translocase protein TatA
MGIFEPSPEKLVIVLIIAMIVLGPKRLPEVGKSLGKGIREFKDGITGSHDEAETPPPPPVPAASITPPPASPAYTPPAPSDQVSTKTE